MGEVCSCIARWSARLTRAIAICMVCSLGSVTAWGAEVRLVADAHVNSAMPTVNSGSISNLNVGGGYTALLQFDLSMLPSGTTSAQVSRAVLRLYVNRMTAPGAISLAPVTAAWGEYSVTFASQPTVGSVAASFTTSQPQSFIAVDVTALVQGWISNPNTNNGLQLTSATAAVQFDSKENDETAHAATLDVELVDAGPAGATGAAGTAGSNGLQGPIGLTGPAGPAGVAGAAGVTGLAGPQGVPGATGATGPAGPQGLAGTSGAAGMAYQGSYNSTQNYGLGDVVLWQGSSYTSLIASNHGNTPSSSSQWAVLAAQGPAGPTGATGAAGQAGPQGLVGSAGPNGSPGPQGLQGIPGQAGAQGLSGAAGAAGLSGPMGPQGNPGPVGIKFQGSYSATTNYALADGVFFNGSGYVSLVASNQGNTPDQSTQQWAQFAAAGGMGATGSVGAPGATGATGPAGSQGLTGPAGGTGAIGTQGPPVANYTGNYQSSSNYALNDAVSFQGSTYISLTASNQGNTPSLSTVQWAVLAAQGTPGMDGAPGIAGPAGPAGPAGVAGAPGPQGPPVTFQGGWATGTAYAVGDVVGYGGSSYVAILPNTGHEPDQSPQNWGLLAAGAVGPAGATGATGMQGPTGNPGPSGSSGPQGAIGPAGANGTNGGPGLNWQGTYTSTNSYALADAVVYQGSSYISLAAGNYGNTPSTSPVWSLLAAAGTAGSAGATGAQGIPGASGAAGAQGSDGQTGATGPAGLNFRGPWTSITGYAANDAVTYNGSTYLSLQANTSSEPDLFTQLWSLLAQVGNAGPSGPSGAAATVTIGAVTTGAAGSAATITNVGNSTSAILNFSLPQGPAGTSGGGTGGGNGTSGIPYASTYHSVAYTSYDSVNGTTSSIAEVPAILTWVPAGCTATALNVFSQQGNAITITLRAGTPGNMADTALSCTASPGQSCTAGGSVAIPANSFVDFSIVGANSTAAAVWTVLACN
jgi:hypothetical protein